jgi:LysM repeat protein
MMRRLWLLVLIAGLVAMTLARWPALGSFRDSAAGLVTISTGTFVPIPAAPEPPSGLDCQCLGCFWAGLEWTASPSPGVEGYRIYHRGPFRPAFSLLDEVPVPSTTYDKLRPSFFRHRYFVTAFLQSSESEPSNTIEVHCRPGLFNLPAPCHLTAENHHSQRVIELTWEEVANATDYAVLRATTSGGPYDIVGTRRATTYIDAAVSEGVTYYYLVLALDADGNESDPSQEVVVPDTEPSPPREANSLAGERDPEPSETPFDDSAGSQGLQEAQSTAAEKPTSPPSLPTIEYQVQPGDSLIDIAARFGTTVEALAQLNGLQDPNVILYGSTLNVPYVGEDSGDASAGMAPWHGRASGRRGGQ